MKVRNLVRRISSGELHFFLGRFAWVRASYSLTRGILERRSPLGEPVNGTRTLFPEVDVAQAVQRIRDDAVSTVLRLPSRIIHEIELFCRCELLFARNDPSGPRFRHSEVKNGYTPDGRPAPIGPITDPMRCKAVTAVVEDPVLREIVCAYLGYMPKKVTPLLYWSFASNFTDDERRLLLQHVIDYHYDVSGYNFVYASFYILACDRSSGAHVIMRKSHRSKPLRMLLGSSVAREENVHRYFGRENELVIEGPAGTGFVEDTSCYHRASPPTHGDRLMLQIRYS